MMRIDSHQHFWKFDPVRDSWITEEMAAIRKDFGPGDLLPLLRNNHFDGSVAVQSDQSEAENIFHLKHADEHDFIKGVVGWIDLQAPDVEEKLVHYRSYRKLKGFRHVLQSEAQRNFMLRPAFRNGISKLANHGFAYDILIFADQLSFLPAFVSSFPNQKFVIDHMAKPDIRNHAIDEWRAGIRAIGAYKNVHCKISGMVTEANWKTWKPADFVPYLDSVVESFGIDRVMFGSDWPVCLVAATYPQVVNLVDEYFSSFTQYEQELFFGRNAARFYNLEN